MSKQRKGPMPDPITLIVRFTMGEAVKDEFIAALKEVFVYIQQEENFIEASLQQDRRDPQSLLIYETWRETPESFLQNQMSKAYRGAYEAKLVKLNVERSASFYEAVAEWKKG